MIRIREKMYDKNGSEQASDEQMAGRAWIRWSDINVEPSDLPCLR